MDLQKILKEQKKYTASDGKLGRLANLRGADLKWADLREANLRGANLTRANLSWADLRYADLTAADLTRARGITYIGFDRRRWVLVCWWKNGKPYFTVGCRKVSQRKKPLSIGGVTNTPTNHEVKYISLRSNF